VAKGSWRYYLGLPAANDGLVILLLKSAGLVSDDVLDDYVDIATLLAGTSDEADFTGYSRKTLTSGITITQDNTNNRVDADIADLTWTAAGGPLNNALSKLIVAYDNDISAGTDSNLLPVAHFDFVTTTDGTDLLAEINAAGLLRAAAG
jgi:hypothetical protein